MIRQVQPITAESVAWNRPVLRGCDASSGWTADGGVKVSDMVAQRCLKRDCGSACGVANPMISPTVAATLICCCGFVCGVLPCGTHCLGPAMTAKISRALRVLK